MSQTTAFPFLLYSDSSTFLTASKTEERTNLDSENQTSLPCKSNLPRG
jgi:hypothetical protein